MLALFLVAVNGFRTTQDIMSSLMALVLGAAAFYIGLKLDGIQEIYAYAEALAKAASKLPPPYLSEPYEPLPPIKKKKASAYLRDMEYAMMVALSVTMILLLLSLR